MASISPPPVLTPSDLRGHPGRRRSELAMRLVFLSAATASLIITGLIVLALVGEAWNFVSRVDPAALLAGGWFPRRGMYDIPTILGGTLLIAGIGMLIAIPLGLGAAIYLAEYASRRARSFLKPILEMLAAVPSIVLGYFALQWISPTLVAPVCSGGASVFNMAAAGIAVGILVTPLIASVAEDAMYAVPQSLREASYGLGARKRSTSIRVVVPAAVSGIVAALIIGLSRAIGETMIVAIAAGGTGGSLFSLNPCGQGQTMTAAMTALATGSDQVRGADLAYPSLFFVGLLLFAMTFALNVFSERFVRRVRVTY
ncbi:MAG: phosphate ABC transporter permease subunit PstC [Candidatus Limnocylindria bacterium]